jgi:hypothetical protein
MCQIPRRDAATELDDPKLLEIAKKNLAAGRPVKLKEVEVLFRVHKSSVYRNKKLKKAGKGLFTAESVIRALK